MQVKPKTREMTPEAFLRRVKRLYGEVRSDITKALKEAGNDPKKLPKKLWEEIEERERHALALLLMGFGASAMNQGLYEWQTWMQATGRELPGKRSEQAYRKLQTLANKRSRWTARRVNRTTKRRLREQFRDFEPGDSTLSNVRDVISDSRINTTFRTEMRRSLAIGTQAVYEVGRSTQEVHSVLILGSCNHCEVCPLFDRVEIAEVERYFPQGIPLHPNCCCDQVLVFGDRQDLIEEGLIDPFPNHRAIRQAMRDAGFDIPPKKKFRKSVGVSGFYKTSKPEIRDADGDGLIYDGTKWERPVGAPRGLPDKTQWLRDQQEFSDLFDSLESRGISLSDDVYDTLDGFEYSEPIDPDDPWSNVDYASKSKYLRELFGGIDAKPSNGVPDHISRRMDTELKRGMQSERFPEMNRYNLFQSKHLQTDAEVRAQIQLLEPIEGQMLKARARVNREELTLDEALTELKASRQYEVLSRRVAQWDHVQKNPLSAELIESMSGQAHDPSEHWQKIDSEFQPVKEERDRFWTDMAKKAESLNGDERISFIDQQMQSPESQRFKEHQERHNKAWLDEIERYRGWGVTPEDRLKMSFTSKGDQFDYSSTPQDAVNMVRNMVSNRAFELPDGDTFTASFNVSRSRDRAAYDPEEKEVLVHVNESKKVLVHELGHALEYSNPAALRRLKEFRDMRVKRSGTPDEPMANYSDFYTQGEIGNKDGFAHLEPRLAAYNGKKYSSGGTEILSMALESLSAGAGSASKFIKEDPEYFNFTRGLLSGRLLGENLND